MADFRTRRRDNQAFPVRSGGTKGARRSRRYRPIPARKPTAKFHDSDASPPSTLKQYIEEAKIPFNDKTGQALAADMLAEMGWDAYAPQVRRREQLMKIEETYRFTPEQEWMLLAEAQNYYGRSVGHGSPAFLAALSDKYVIEEVHDDQLAGKEIRLP